MIRRLVLGMCAAVMILAAVSVRSQEDSGTCTGDTVDLYDAIQSVRQMRNEILDALSGLKTAAKTAGSDQLDDMRYAEEDMNSTLTQTAAALTDLERCYHQATSATKD